MTKPISLTAGLKDVSSRGKTGEKMAIQVDADELLFDPDDKVMSAAVAQAILEQTKTFLLQGKFPDGRPLPPLAGSTLARREDEAAQGSRGGEAHERIEDVKTRARAVKNYQRDYTAPRSGKTFTPKAGGPRGVVSGMLVESFFARPNRDGKGVTIYVSSKRGKPRSGEKLSALQTTYGEGATLLSQALMKSRSVQKAIADALAMSLISKGTQNAIKRLAKNVAGSIEALNEVGEAAEGAAE